MLHNQILSNKKVKKRLPWILISFGLFALFCIVSVFGYYGYIFSNFKIDASTDHFGQFGDFIGGTLNPILAFLSFMALLYTIKIQTEELEATRKELEGSRIAQQEQSDSLKLQNEATKIQIFENTFFQLIELFIKIRDDIYVEITIKQNSVEKHLFSTNYEYYVNNMLLKKLRDYKETETKFKLMSSFAIREYLEIYKCDCKNFDKNYESNLITYFSHIYQILKFISESYIENKQRYINIFRVQFIKEELEFLFYHCLGSIGKRKFKKLVEDYEFFEHIILNEMMKKQLLEYNIKAFGKNEKLLGIYNNSKNEAVSGE